MDCAINSYGRKYDFIYNPTSYQRFMTNFDQNIYHRVLERDEKLIKLYRHAVWSQIRSMIIFCIFLLLPFFLLFPLFRLGWWGILIFFLFLILAFAIGLRQWFIWQGSVFLVTNKRVVNIMQRGFFQRSVSECSLAKIQEVRYSHKGIIQTMCKMGTLEIDTTGSEAKLIIANLHEPQEAQKLLRHVQAMKEDDRGDELSLSQALAMIENIRFRLGEEKFEKLLRIVR